MKGQRITGEERNRSLTVAFRLLRDGRTYDEVHEELQAMGLYPFARNSLRAYYSRWNRGEFPHIIIEPTGGVIQRPPSSDALEQRPTEYNTDEMTKPSDEPRDTPLDTDEVQPDVELDRERCDTPSDAVQPPEADNAVIQREDKDRKLLGRIREMLKSTEIPDRGTTAKGRQSAVKTKLVAARLPVILIDELHALGGRFSHHIEKAVMLYVQAMRASEL